MVHVPTDSTRILRSGQTGRQCSERNKSNTITTAGNKQNSRRKRISFDIYDQAHENIRKKNKKSQRRSTDDAKNNDTNDVATNVTNKDTSATNKDQGLVHKATRKALIGIGKVTYDQARGNIRKENRRSQRRSTGAAKNIDTNNVAINIANNDTTVTNEDQRPVCRATQKALIEIGKVFQHEKQDKSKLDIELGIDSSEEGSKDFDC